MGIFFACPRFISFPGGDAAHVCSRQKMSKTNQKILLIDDEEDSLELRKYNLSKEGYEVKTASDCIKGIDSASDKEWNDVRELKRHLSR